MIISALLVVTALSFHSLVWQKFVHSLLQFTAAHG